MPTLMIRMSRIGVGNALRLASAMIVPRPSTAVLSGLRSSPSSTHSPALSPPGCSPFVLSPQSSPSTLRSSGSRFSVACGSLCHLFLHDAVVGVRLMLWVTMSLPALGLVFSGHGVGRLNVPLPGSAGRLVPLSPQGDRQRLAVVGRLAACGCSTAGAALAEARRAKERTYPEFADARRCRLVVLGLEVGGRWSAEAAAVIRLLARARARSAAVTQRAACVAAFVSRWSGSLSIAAARSFAASLLSLPISNTANLDGEAPLLSDVLADSSETPPFASCMG
ncbi:hypothetical protein AK812_SmicGene47449 [Symbiodinium microadriaticum]|uniref:Uncharacterized protein n=1 Tax=Symbiodinium microadriaticum TaxID=2951 RepID=A0A1Q9BRM2_SYMMI|nr:hypothetical protein AK812_SmicGene47449 [Symbiodinium microadriaticum]